MYPGVSIIPKKILVSVVAGLVFTISLIILLTPLYGSFSIHKTPFRNTMLATIQGDHIYGYSGASFYKADIDTQNEVTILSSGLRLPTIESSHWIGDEGIVLTFTDGGVIRSAVEEALTARGERWGDITRSYAWFLDFKTNQLHLVNQYGIIGDSVSYSNERQGFYYVGYSDTISEEEQEDAAPLQLFSLQDKTSQIIEKDIAAPFSLSYISKCPENSRYIVCTIESEDDKYAIYGIGNGIKTKLTDQEFSAIFSTANPSIYIGTINESSPETSQEDDELAAVPYRIDIDSIQTTKLNTTVNASRSLLANTAARDTLYVFEPAVGDDTDEIEYLSGAKNLLGYYRSQIKAAKTESESKSILGPYSRGSGGQSIYHDVEGNTYLITPSSQSYSPETLPEDQVETQLTECFRRHTKGYKYTPELKQFKINIAYDSNFKKSIVDFSECAIEVSPMTMYGYSYLFLGISVTDGRFVTD